MQMRPALVLATATSGVLVALAYVALFKQPKRDDGGGPAPPTVTGRQAAFHLDATPAQRREILEATFPKIGTGTKTKTAVPRASEPSRTTSPC